MTNISKKLPIQILKNNEGYKKSPGLRGFFYASLAGLK